MAFLHIKRWPLEASVQDLMQAEVISVAEDQDQETITAVIAQHHFLAVPLVDWESRYKLSFYNVL
jgi:Mg/Co/Ni transporter MgtE